MLRWGLRGDLAAVSVSVVAVREGWVGGQGVMHLESCICIYYWGKIYSRNLKGGYILFCWGDSFIQKKLNTKVTKRVVC